MRKRYYILFLNFFITCAVLAQNNNIEELMWDDNYISSSFLVVSPGEKIYSVGGHLALRMKCPVQNVDYIYEFDAVLENDETLIYQYLNRTLEGRYIRLFASDFFAKVISENREFIEYPLSLTPDQKIRLWSCLDNEVDSNSIYPFEPTSINCCSMLLAILEKSIGQDLFAKSNVINASETTGRDYIQDFFEYSPWVGLLWNILIGCEFDRPTSVINLMYPKIIGKSLTSIINPANNEPLVVRSDSSEVLFRNGEKHILSPEDFFLMILLISVFLSIMNTMGRLSKASLFFDIVLIIATIVIGLVLWYMFMTSMIQNNVKFNMLLILFTPIPLLLIFLRNKRIWEIYSMVIAIISASFLIGINYITQIQKYGLWLFVITLLIRSLCYYRMVHNNKQKFNIIN